MIAVFFTGFFPLTHLGRLKAKNLTQIFIFFQKPEKMRK
jgi:hypothetical protein